MRIFKDPRVLPSRFREGSVCIGVFDGVHRGHLRLLRAMQRYARRRGMPQGVVTFYPHPVKLLRYERHFQEIITLTQKLALFKEAGVGFVVLCTFDARFSRLSAQRFLEDYLAKKLFARAVFIGEDFVMGRDRRHADSFRHCCERKGIALKKVPLFKMHGRVVSSTAIRDYLRRGDIRSAELLLGRRLFMEGHVVKGKGLGKTIGIPTINIQFSHELIPRPGVYSCELRIHNHALKGALYIGNSFAQVRDSKLFYPERQTADAEVYVFNFNARRYGRVKNITIRPIRFLRAPKTFTALAVFKKQAAKDIANIKRKV